MNSSDVIVMGPGSGTVTPEMEAACGVLTAAPDGAAIAVRTDISQAMSEAWAGKGVQIFDESADHPLDGDFFDALISPNATTIDTFPKKMQWLARLEAAEREHESRLKAIKDKIAELEPYVLEQMAENGIDRQTVDGFTFYTERQIWVNKLPEKDGVTTEMVCDALKEAGLGYMVKDGYSASSLTSKVKEWMKEAEAEGRELDVHPALQKVLKIGKGVKLVARKA